MCMDAVRCRTFRAILHSRQVFSLDVPRSTVGTTPLLELTSEMGDLPVVHAWLGVDSFQQLVVEAIAVSQLVQLLMNQLLTHVPKEPSASWY